MIERSIKSKSAVSVLHEDFNDIDIYVEDTAKESKKIYSEILSRVFDNKYNIDNIIPLGGSLNVIKEWRDNKSNTDNRLKIYIIDGDYHNINESIGELLGEEANKDHRGLFILPRYCLENYLIDFNSFIEIIYEEIAEDNRDFISDTLNLENWFNINNQILQDLFIYNSICISYKVPVKTSKFKISELMGPLPGICCDVLVEKRIDHLKSKIKDKSIDIDIFEEYEIRKERLKDLNFIYVVTGKDFLFPLIKQYISDKYNCLNMSQISLKIRLSKTCDIDELIPIKNNLI